MQPGKSIEEIRRGHVALGRDLDPATPFGAMQRHPQLAPSPGWHAARRITRRRLGARQPQHWAGLARAALLPPARRRGNAAGQRVGGEVDPCHRQRQPGDGAGQRGEHVFRALARQHVAEVAERNAQRQQPLPQTVVLDVQGREAYQIVARVDGVRRQHPRGEDIPPGQQPCRRLERRRAQRPAQELPPGGLQR